MCVSTSRPSPPPVVAQPAPASYASSTPEFDTQLADMDTAAQAAAKKKQGKNKLKVAPKADPSLSVAGGMGGSSTSSGVNISS